MSRKLNIDTTDVEEGKKKHYNYEYFITILLLSSIIINSANTLHILSRSPKLNNTVPKSIVTKMSFLY